MRRITRTTCLWLACCMPAALHASVPEPSSAPVSADDDYSRGTQALDQQRWQDAVASFDKVIEAKGRKADAALYWKAYALKKLDRTSLVGSTCTQLRTLYVSSTWNKDCTTLTAGASSDESAGDNGRQRDDVGSDADLKVLALNSLLNRDPAQALPLIRNMLSSNGSPELKHRALAMVAQNPSPDARAFVREVALGKFAPGEQKQAIEMMGVFQGKAGNDTLAEIYRSSADYPIKRAVISAFFISGDAQRMVDLARNEKDLRLKHDIVAQLALMHDKAATDYMLELLK
jgi:hypothetical protein